MPPVADREPRLDDGPHLIAYADRLGGSLRGLADLLQGPLCGAFHGVHILPFYLPYDGADAGFDPRDHALPDPRLGTWQDIRALSRSHTVMADLIVNHISSDSPLFRDVVERGEESPHAGMFLTLGSVFPHGATENDLAMIYRPRPGLPFTPMTLGGTPRLVWTTFTPRQVDLDIRDAGTWRYITSVIDALTAAGVTLLRLDAVGYTGKTPGTDCFMTPAAVDFIARIRDYAHGRGARVLLEIHGHHAAQLRAATSADYVYDFALPPLVLHALLRHDPRPLSHWLSIRPRNTVTVLDTHDGIGIIDVGPSGGPDRDDGLLDDRQMDALVATIHTNSAGASRLATGASASNLDLYQVNCAFLDAMAGDEDRYLAARLLQLFLPGVPQVYYMGLLGGRNDVSLLRRTGVGRDINRHHYSREEVDAALDTRVVRAQLAALKLRAAHPAFRGEFTHALDGSRLALCWRNGEHRARLVVDASSGMPSVEATDPAGADHVVDARGLVSLASLVPPAHT